MEQVNENRPQKLKTGDDQGREMEVLKVNRSRNSLGTFAQDSREVKLGGSP